MSYRHGLTAVVAFALLGVVSAPAAHAETTTPSFAVQSTAGSHARLGFNAYERGDYAKAISFTNKATAKGIKKSRRSIAYANLCASYGQQSELDAALEACNTALELAPKNWRALNNRGVVYFLSGNKEAAKADFTTAAGEPKAVVAQANADLMAETKLAIAE